MPQDRDFKFPPMGLIISFFFDASRATYAGYGVKIHIEDLPGSKVLFLQNGDFTYHNIYDVAEEGISSSGTTTIRYRRVPVWKMHYCGYYRKDATPFLKEALRKSYGKREFVGGRGPSFYTNGQLYYVNTPERNDFEDFHGTERVYDRDLLGYNHYFGCALITPAALFRRSDSTP